MEKEYNNFVIRVMRKEKPPPDKYVYSPIIDLYDTCDPDKRRCFDIRIESSYLVMSQVRVTPCRVVINEIDDSKYAFALKKKQYIQTVSFSEIDVRGISKYIFKTDFDILNELRDKTNFMTINEHLCVNCKAKLKGPDVFR